MNSSDTRVSAYLDDLARMLADLDPATRDDVLAGVREHLDATLAEHPDDPAAVDAALLRLGPPEQVAAEARADLPAAPTAAAPERHPRRVRIAAATALGLVALPTVLTLVARALDSVQAARGPGWSEDVGLFLGPHPSEVFFLLPLSFPVWLVAVVVALVGPDLSGRTKTWLVTLGPVMVALVVTCGLLRDPMVVSQPLSFIGLPVFLGWVVLTGRHAWRETRT